MDMISRTELTEQDSLESVAWTGHPGQDRLDEITWYLDNIFGQDYLEKLHEHKIRDRINTRNGLGIRANKSMLFKHS